MFLRQESYVEKAQVTILDYPSAERVGKILDGTARLGTNNEDLGKKYGFDKNFFASILPSDQDIPSLFLLIDSYFSLKETIGDDVNSFGVGIPISGSLFYNHPAIKSP